MVTRERLQALLTLPLLSVWINQRAPELPAGERQNAEACPLATYLRESLGETLSGDDYVSVNAADILVRCSGEKITVDNPFPRIVGLVDDSRHEHISKDEFQNILSQI